MANQSNKSTKKIAKKKTARKLANQSSIPANLLQKDKNQLVLETIISMNKKRTALGIKIAKASVSGLSLDRVKALKDEYAQLNSRILYEVNKNPEIIETDISGEEDWE